MAGSKEVMVTLLWLLLVCHQLQYTETIQAGDCSSRKDLKNMQPVIVKPGVTTKLVANDTDTCGHNNNSYVLVYENQNSGKLESLYDQESRGFVIQPIYLNNSGVYCVYKQCRPERMDHCCIKLTATKMQILFSESTQLEALEYGTCYVSMWPRPPMDSVTVLTTNNGNNGSCKIETLSVRYDDFYTTAVFFRVHVDSSCNRIRCYAPPGMNQRSIIISQTPPANTTPSIDNPNTSPSTDNPNTSPSTDNPNTSPSTNNPNTSPSTDNSNTDVPPTNLCGSGVPGLNRTTLWIIVLTLSMLSLII